LAQTGSVERSAQAEEKGMKKNTTKAKITVRGTEINVIQRDDKHYISLTDMIKAKDGDFFISDWLRNRNTVEFLGIWETVHNPKFNSGEFAIIKSQTRPPAKGARPTPTKMETCATTPHWSNSSSWPTLKT
jgi:hypothetical protein